jgi:RHS repeat-associated protein
MEYDEQVKGGENSYTTEFRQYDPRLGRWLSLDPLMMKFPSMSPYTAFNNNPITYIDPDGQEHIFTLDGKYLGKVGESNLIRILKSDDVKKIAEAKKYIGQGNIEALNKMTTTNSAAPTSAQNAVSAYIYNTFAKKNIQFSSMTYRYGTNEAGSCSGNGVFTQNAKLSHNNDYVVGYFYNQINLWTHEEMHNKDLTNNQKFRTTSQIHFDIFIKQSEHWSWDKTTPNFKDYMFEVANGYLKDMSEDLFFMLVTAGSLDELEKVYNSSEFKDLNQKYEVRKEQLTTVFKDKASRIDDFKAEETYEKRKKELAEKESDENK